MKDRRPITPALAVALALMLVVPAAPAVPSAEGDEQALLADADYAAGLQALRAGDASAALRRFEAALRRFPDAADLHNELGFTFRKLRRMDESFAHYRRALSINPDHRGAHEYIGEAYLMVGDLPGAQRHLQHLRRLCLLPCDELKELEQAIAAYRSGQRPP